MKISTFAIKIWRWASILFVVGALAWTYSVFPEMVGFAFDSAGAPIEFTTKDNIFYISMVVILLNNVVLRTVSKQVHKIPSSILPIPNRSAWAANLPELHEVLTNWLNALMAAINTIGAFTLAVLATVNSNQFTYKLSSFEWFPYLSFALLAIIMIAPPLVFLRKPAPDSENG